MRQILSPDGEIVNKEAIQSLRLTAEDLKKIYRLMIMTRLLDREGRKRAYLNHMTLFIGPFGQEAAEIASAYAMLPEEKVYIYGRSLGAALGKGVSPKSIFDGFFGNPGPEGIKDFISHGTRLPYVSVGVHIPQAVGDALANQILREKNLPTAVYFGDGATSEGYFHSGLNWAAIFKIPTIFFCENNKYAISTPTKINNPLKTFGERALGYGIDWNVVDGNDALAVYGASKEALERARNEGKPTLIELVTYRLGPHTTAVGEICKIPEEEKIEAKKNDPLRRFQKFILSEEAQKIFNIDWGRERDDKLYENLTTSGKVKELFADTNTEPRPEDIKIYYETNLEVKKAAEESYQEFLEAQKDGSEIVKKTVLWQRPRVNQRYQKTSGFSLKKLKNIPARDAIALAVYDAMRFDPNIIYFGEDVAGAGGVMRTTALREDLAAEERFVREQCPNWQDYILHKYLPFEKILPERANQIPKRIFDTPLDESGIIGIGLGMALSGARPIMEIQFSGFVRIGLDFADEFSRMIHRYAGLINVPGVILLPFGGGERIEYHRESETPFFLNNPGLIVACPSQVQDFYDMLRASIASDRPVVFFSHIDLYREPKIDELLRRPPSKPIEDFGIRKVTEGEDVTVVSYGKLIYECEKAIKLVKKEKDKFSAEILDARILSPLKIEIIVESVRKTGRLVIIQEEPKRYGFGAEISAAVAEETNSFEYLKAPIKRVAPPETHFPPSKFWSYYIPQPEDIAKAIIEAINY